MARMESPEERYENVSARLSGSRLERFEAYVDQSDESKSAVIRDGIDAVTTGEVDTESTPLRPPTEDRLAWAYDRLCKVANADGIVSGESARRVCSGGPQNISKKETTDLILKPLRRRGYIRRQANIYGDEAYQLVGWGKIL